MSDLGWIDKTGFGPAELSDQAILAHLELHKLDMSRAMVKLIKRLSRAYIWGYSEGTKADYRPPLAWPEFDDLLSRIDEVSEDGDWCP